MNTLFYKDLLISPSSTCPVWTLHHSRGKQAAAETLYCQTFFDSVSASGHSGDRQCHVVELWSRWLNAHSRGAGIPYAVTCILFDDGVNRSMQHIDVHAETRAGYRNDEQDDTQGFRACSLHSLPGILQDDATALLIQTSSTDDM
jgi:hypothetical protein